MRKLHIVAILCLIFCADRAYPINFHGWTGGSRFLKNNEAEIKFDSDNDSWVSTKPVMFGGIEPSIEFQQNDGAKILWENSGYDSLIIGTPVNSNTGSGVVAVIDKADIGSINRTMNFFSPDPLFRVYSSDEASADDYIELKHDQSAAWIKTGEGDLRFYPRNGSLKLYHSNINCAHLEARSDINQLSFITRDESGNQFIIANVSGSFNDFAHPTTVDPTLFIHSDSDPESVTNEWVSFDHNKSHGQIKTGKGDLQVYPYSKIFTVNNILKLKTLTGDPQPPDDGEAIIWRADGSGTRASAGDIVIAVRNGSTTKYKIIFDFDSEGNLW